MKKNLKNFKKELKLNKGTVSILTTKQTTKVNGGCETHGCPPANSNFYICWK